MAWLAAMLLAPAAALAGTADGGTSAPSGAALALPSTPGGAAPSSQALPTGPNTLRPRPGGAIIGRVALVAGQLTPAQAHRRVVLELLDVNRRWIAVGGARADASGNFLVSWRPRHIGRFLLRATPGDNAAAATAAARPTAPIEVYRSAIATWFGPGSYGSRTACGQILTPALMGVAHRTLPCGTLVDIAYGNQTLSVPVVDRGPFTNGVSYDLTAATAQALGVGDTARIAAAPNAGTAPVAP